MGARGRICALLREGQTRCEAGTQTQSLGASCVGGSRVAEQGGGATKVTYKALVTTGATDLAGNPLDQHSTTTGLQQKGWFFTVSLHGELTKSAEVGSSLVAEGRGVAASALLLGLIHPSA